MPPHAVEAQRLAEQWRGQGDMPEPLFEVHAGPRVGSLFSGYGGLDMAVTATLGGSVAWHCEIEPAPSRPLAHHHPGVPNLGDITAVDWATVEPIDVLTGGFPCQDVSSAGRRRGMRPDTRSGLWQHMAYAIDQLRPELVVIENVRGLLSADAHCDLEPCPWCLGDDEGRPLRALGAVLGDLADLGYDARWCGLRAADVGAPHGRYRIFISARPAALGVGARPAAVDPRLGVVGGTVRGRGVHHGPVRLPEPASAARPVHDGRGRRPTVLEHDWSWSAERAVRAARARHEADLAMGGVSSGRGRDTSEPDVARPWGSTPCPCCGGDDSAAPPSWADGSAPADTRREHGQRGTIEQRGTPPRARPASGVEPRRPVAAADAESVGRGEGRPEPARLVRRPDTPLSGLLAAPDADGAGPQGRGLHRAGGPTPVGDGAPTPADPYRDAVRQQPVAEPRGVRPSVAGQPVLDWGAYEPAIRRWELILGRPAPAPTMTGARGGQQLSPAFVEWMMGLPAGHVTAVPGISRNDQLKMLGNGVCPQQAEAALRWLLAASAGEVAA